MADDKKGYLIKSGDLGEVRITPEVITTIAALAALEVDGVFHIGNSITRDMIEKHSTKNLSKSVRTQILENVISIDIALSIGAGCSITKVVPLVQEKVKSTVENMTSLDVKDVNVSVVDITGDAA